jgi:hypothetical protein
MATLGTLEKNAQIAAPFCLVSNNRWFLIGIYGVRHYCIGFFCVGCYAPSLPPGLSDFATTALLSECTRFAQFAGDLYLGTWPVEGAIRLQTTGRPPELRRIIFRFVIHYGPRTPL